MKKNIRIVLTLLMMSFVILTIVQEFAECHHDCCGENCPICHLLLVNQSNLQLLSFTLCTLTLCLTSFVLSYMIMQIHTCVPVSDQSLISKKTRLNN